MIICYARFGCSSFFHFGQFLALLPPLTTQKIKISKKMKKAPGGIIIKQNCTKNPDHMLYCSWDMARGRCNYFLFWAILPLYLPNNLKNENLKKMKRKKTPEDIILHKCTKNHDHMLYYSWDMVHERCNYFLFWAIFCPFTFQQPKKTNFQKSENKMPGYIIILLMCSKNYD